MAPPGSNPLSNGVSEGSASGLGLNGASGFNGQIQSGGGQSAPATAVGGELFVPAFRFWGYLVLACGIWTEDSLSSQMDYPSRWQLETCA